ncbi:Transcription factor ORG2 [Glycine max]|nr:Transcription factor ORG2 [Glycine max]
MVALFSPPVFSTKGWLLEEDPLSYDVSSEYSFPYQFYSPQTQIELEIERSTSPSPEDPAMVKKLSHNASERDRRKKWLIKRISRQLQGDAVNKDSQRRISHHNSDFVVSTSRLNDCEAVVHISSYEAHKAPLSEILQCLENNGLLLLNASSSETFGGRVFYNLHFQVEKTQRLESEILTEKLLSIYEKQRIF